MDISGWGFDSAESVSLFSSPIYVASGADNILVNANKKSAFFLCDDKDVIGPKLCIAALRRHWLVVGYVAELPDRGEYRNARDPT